jgi:hypothetical protein
MVKKFYQVDDIGKARIINKRKRAFRSLKYAGMLYKDIAKPMAKKIIRSFTTGFRIVSRLGKLRGLTYGAYGKNSAAAFKRLLWAKRNKVNLANLLSSKMSKADRRGLLRGPLDYRQSGKERGYSDVVARILLSRARQRRVKEAARSGDDPLYNRAGLQKINRRAVRQTDINEINDALQKVRDTEFLRNLKTF